MSEETNGPVTETRYKHTLLFVDDEELITKALVRLFRKEKFEILTAANGAQGLERIQAAGKPISLIVSDQRMPGMEGTSFLEKTKELCPDAMRILLTGYSDMEAIVEAINAGEIYRYLTKPWNDTVLINIVRQALDQYELVLENRRLLELTTQQNEELNVINKHLEEKVQERTREIAEKNVVLEQMNQELEAIFYNAVKAMGSLAELNVPELARHAKFVCAFSIQLARLLGMDEQEVTQLEIAALLHDIGKIGFPEKFFEYREQFLSVKEQELYRRHPEHGQAAVQFIEKLDQVSISIRGHHERYDGKGYPDGLAGEDIPLGARIIAVADAYDKIVNMKLDLDRGCKQMNAVLGTLMATALAHLKKNSLALYDPVVVDVCIDFVEPRLVTVSKAVYKGASAESRARQKVYWKEVNLSINELKAGMVLARSLHSSKGRFLLVSNTKLTDRYIQNLKQYHLNDPLTEIYVLSN